MTGQSVETLRQILSAQPSIGIDPGVGGDDEFVLDSLALTWLVYRVQEMFQVDLDVDDERLSGVTSIRIIADYVDSVQRDSGHGR